MSEIDSLIDALLEAKSADEILAARKAIGAWSAERDKALSQVAVLREALLNCRNHIVLHDDEGLAQHSDMIEQADLILHKTEAAVKEYERELRNRVRDEIAAAFEAMGSGYEMFAPTAAQHVLDMKETP